MPCWPFCRGYSDDPENRRVGARPGDGTRIRYQVGTKVTTFKVDHYEALERFENEHIRSELVKAVASKL